MDKFLLLPSRETCVALVSCLVTILLSPFVSITTKFLFLASSVVFAQVTSHHQVIYYVVSLVVSNIVFLFDPKVHLESNTWIFTFLTTNTCAAGFYIICKQISSWNVLSSLSHECVWKVLPEISFIDVGDLLYETPHSLYHHPTSEEELQRELKAADQKGEFVKTDFGVDVQGGVQRLLQTTIKPVKYRGCLLGYCKIVTQVQLPQIALYDLFTSIDGSESTYKELFGHGLDHSRLMLDPKGIVVSWNPGVERVKGYTRDDLLGKHMSMFYTVEDRIAGRPLADLAVARSEGHMEMEGWMLRNGGDLFWANVNITAVHNNSGQLMGFSEVTRDCTEKKRNLDTLHATEEKYHLLVSSVTDYTIIMLDREGIITTWNAGAQKINGYHAEEVIGRHFSLFYGPEALAERQPERELEIATRDGRFEDEGWRVKKDGKKFWASVVLSAIYNARKEIVGFSKVTRDITDKMLAQTALRTSEERFQLLVSSIKDYSILMVDLDGKITTWNTGVYKMAGFKSEDIVGQHISILYTPEQREAGLPHAELDIALKEGRYEGEGWRACLDGTKIWASFTLTAMYDGGVLKGYSSITRNITEQKRAQDQLHMVEERFQLLISSVRDYAIFMLNPEGYIVSWNLGAQRIKGYAAEEVIGKHFSIVYTPEDCRDGKPQHALHIAETEGRYEDEGLRVRKDGSVFWANVIITAMRDKDGRLVGFSKVTRDVTDRRNTEANLMAAKVSAEAAALAKQSFLAMMSHEIRTPLHAVITLSLLLQNTELNETQLDYLETIHSSSKQLLGIINDILDFSKIESGKMDLVVKPFNLRQCIEETIDLVLVKQCSPKPTNQIDVVYIMTPGVPENIVSDSVRVRQVLMNYVSNAVKFTAKGEVVVKVTCEPKKYNENNTVMLTFAVHDTGIGIKSPNLEELFQPFFQIVPGTPQVYGGTGLGLVISKKLSYLMGGTVWVESEEGVGSTFFFSITAQVAQPTAPTTPTKCSKFNFLVIDESPAGAESLVLLLQYFGCSVRSTHDLNDAVTRTQKEKFHAVFVSRTLHAQHQERTESLRGSPLYLTGTPDSADYHSTATPQFTPCESMFRAFLPKPYRTDTVRALLYALRGRQQVPGLLFSPSSSPPSSPPPSPAVPTAPGLRILVAEDNLVNRKVARRILENLGYTQVDMVENGKEAVVAVSLKVYDVILMDIQMPYMDGWTATEEIFKRNPIVEKRPSVIAMTAYAYEQDQQKCAQLGMKAHIAKPVDMALLAEILRSCPVRTDTL